MARQLQHLNHGTQLDARPATKQRSRLILTRLSSAPASSTWALPPSGWSWWQPRTSSGRRSTGCRGRSLESETKQSRFVFSRRMVVINVDSAVKSPCQHRYTQYNVWDVVALHVRDAMQHELKKRSTRVVATFKKVRFQTLRLKSRESLKLVSNSIWPMAL